MHVGESKRETCEFCEQGRIQKGIEEIRFHQKTDRGLVFCSVTIPMDICDRCGAKSWGAAAEAIIEEAVRRQRDMLG
jgi:hypothetical protein